MDDPTPTLHHHQLQGEWGCMYAALYAHLGDDGLLEHTNDVSDARWRVRIHEAGHFLQPVWCIHPPDALGGVWASAPEATWEALEAASKDGPPLRLLAHTPGHRGEHQIAIAMRGRAIWISDCRKLAVEYWADWREWRRIKALPVTQLEILQPLDLEAFQVEPAWEALG